MRCGARRGDAASAVSVARPSAHHAYVINLQGGSFWLKGALLLQAPGGPHGANASFSARELTPVPSQGRQFPCFQDIGGIRLPSHCVCDKRRSWHCARAKTYRIGRKTAVGNSGTSRTHRDTKPAIAACRKSGSVCFWSLGQRVAELQEAQNEHRLGRIDKQVLRLDLVVLDELNYVSLSRTASELLFHLLLHGTNGAH